MKKHRTGNTLLNFWKEAFSTLNTYLRPVLVGELHLPFTTPSPLSPLVVFHARKLTSVETFHSASRTNLVLSLRVATMTAALSTRPQRISSLAADRDPRVAKLWLNLPSRSSNVAQPPLDTPSVSSTATLVESSRREKLLTPPPSSTPSSRKIRPLPSTPDAKSPRALPPVPQSAPLAPAQRQRPGHRVTASTSSIPRHPSVLIPGRHSSHARTANFLFVPPASQRPATGDFDPTPSMTASVFPAIAAREIADELERLSMKGPDDADEENDSISPLDEDDDLDEEFSVQVVRGVAYRSADVKRVSRNWHGKWVRREGGLQFDNPDYTSIMKALRAL